MLVLQAFCVDYPFPSMISVVHPSLPLEICTDSQILINKTNKFPFIIAILSIKDQ